MTPAARVQTVIEILDALASSGTPADRLMSGWFRRRRYIGAKDRRAIADHVYGALRSLAALDWWLGRAGAQAETGRLRMLARLALGDGNGRADTAALFDGTHYGPAPLDEAERAVIDRLAGQPLDHPDQPAWVRGNYPEWLEPRLEDVFGEGLAAEMAALNAEAPVDLRVNALKTDRETARAALSGDGLEAAPTAWSPVGLRLAARTTLPALAAFRDGWLEVQDEASQVAALLVDARTGQAVCDVCAGAGGKTLALAAAMANQGYILACDTAAARMHPMASRLARAGVGIVEQAVLPDDPAAWAAERAGAFDRVLVDAPCSGTGAWRRNPDARWRLDASDLAQWTAAQRNILDLASGLVGPGGRLVYVTCSILREENAVQVRAFLDSNPDFAVLRAPAVWAGAVGGPCPAEEDFLVMTPARHGTDGFFAAVLERRP